MHDPSNPVGQTDDEHAESLSFIVRIWKPDHCRRTRCRGWVEEVGSGRRMPFLGLEGLLDEIGSHVDVPRHRVCAWWRGTASKRRRSARSREQIGSRG